MAIERTFSIIKPDATRRNLTGQINAGLKRLVFVLSDKSANN